MERIRQHRRNKAEDSYDNNHNLSPLHFSRMSAGMEYSGPLTMRLSDMSSYENYSPRKYDNKPTKMGSIKHNLKQLQDKLNKARNLLETSNNKKQSQKVQSIMPQLKLFTCNEEDESTMNVDSQAYFKIVAANAKRAKDYYVGTLINSLNGSNQNATKHLRQMMATMRAALSMSLPSVFQIQHRKVNLQRSIKNCSRKTIALQLEETLLCWKSEQSSEHELQVRVGEQKGYILLRPYALSFLKKIAQHFEVIVYSRLADEITKAIVEEIDHQGKYISHLLTNKHCLQLTPEILAKDIRVLDRNIRDTIIIDSSPASFIVQCDNAVPVLPYRGGQDRQLVQLQRFLCRQVSGCSDVRQLCRRWFLLSRFWQFQSEADLIQELFL